MTNHRELRARLAAVESRGVTFLADDFPPFWESASGSEVVDAEGMRYIDFTSAFGVASVGHSHPDVVAAIRDQAGSLMHAMGDVHPNELKVRLMEKLAAFHGAPAKVMLSVTGSDAVETAMKTARLATGRNGILAFEGAYHGLGYGSMTLAGREVFRAPFRDQEADVVRRACYPTNGHVEQSIAQVGAALSAGKIGSVIIEPIQGRGGIVVPADGALRRIAELARKSGALVIFDEVMTGFCRTGRRFAFEHEQVRPDILVVGKALGAGMPISAIVAPPEIMDAWPRSEGEAIQTGTYFGHPLACAAALATLDIMERENLAERAEGLGERLLRRLSRFGARGRGLMVGIECESEALAKKAGAEALKRGLIVLVDGDRSNVIELLPPLTISESLLDEGVGKLEQSLAAAGVVPAC